jgi:hypothetical protein
MTSRDWQWIIGENSINLTVDLWSFMFGICIGPATVVLHFAFATVVIEHWGQR